MELLFHGEWITAPAPTEVPNSVAIAVDATVPIAETRVPSGRLIRSPYRKAARFALLEGPTSTLRKVRSKRDDARLQGDYRVVAALGRPVAAPGEEPTVLAVCLRVSPCAEILLAHSDLVFDAAGASPAELATFAIRLTADSERISELATQSFLYSTEQPPTELRELAARAAAQAGGVSAAQNGGIQQVRPRRRPGSATSATALRLRPEDSEGAPPVALLGGGDYARTQILPAIARARLKPFVIADREPQIAAEVGRAAGFAHATTGASEAIDRLPGRGLVVIATAHDSHAVLAAKALASGHRVFVEKPPIVTREDLEQLATAIAQRPGRVDVGFNRRHHPLTARLRKALSRETGPLTINCLVREISLEPNHWYFWPNQGTRVAGNLCHWIDLGVSLLDPTVQPFEVSVTPPPPAADEFTSTDAERLLSVTFDDGSLLSVGVTDRGDDLLGVQETIDARRGETSARIDDFRTLTVLHDGRVRRSRYLRRDKAHRRMFTTCFQRAIHDEPAFYPAADLGRVGQIQLVACELIENGGTRRVLDPVTA